MNRPIESYAMGSFIRQRESSNLFLKRLQNSGSQSKQKVIYKVAVGGQIDG